MSAGVLANLQLSQPEAKRGHSPLQVEQAACGDAPAIVRPQAGFDQAQIGQQTFSRGVPA